MQRELHNENYEAMCLSNIGTVYFFTGRYDDALTNYERAFQLMDKLKLEGEIPAVLYNLGDTSVRTGQFDEAVSYYLRGLELARKASNKQTTAFGSFSIGNVFKYQGRYGAALSAQEDAVKAYRESQDRSSLMIEALIGYGQTLAMVGRSEESRKILDEALALARETKDEGNTAQALNIQGERLLYGGDSKSAKPFFEQAMQAAARSKDREKLLAVKTSLAGLAVQEGHSRDAIASLKRLALDADSLGLKYASVRCSVFLAEALLVTKDYRAAREAADQALSGSEKFGFKFLAARSHFLSGEIFRLTDKKAEALAQYQQARQGLQDISSEAHSDSFLKRSDLAAILSSPKS
jgi:tetratricopeptide (TPR) repeat protein